MFILYLSLARPTVPFKGLERDNPNVEATWTGEKINIISLIYQITLRTSILTLVGSCLPLPPAGSRAAHVK